MASKLRLALIKYVTKSTSSNFIQPTFEKGRLELKVEKLSGTKLEGTLKFKPNEYQKDVNPAVFNDFKLHQDKIVIGDSSRQINFTNISKAGHNLHFEIDSNDFIKDVLESNPTEVVPLTKKKKVLVEFSSPNIAKQFHMGHLRSTMVGNFVANIIKKVGHDVVKVNYLGDWGTQFGLLITGMELLGYSEESLNTDTMAKLNKAYVHANKMALEDKEIEVKAREIFQKLEDGDEDIVKKWQLLKEFSKNDLVQLYKKLEVDFDEYDWESSYNVKKAGPLLESLEKKGIVGNDEHGRKTVQVDGKSIPLLKSDGSTLYLCRDVLAFFDRRKRHNFDKSYYVVDYSQGSHFKNLKDVCEQIEPGSSEEIEHVQIGRVLNMSTRAGTNVLLHDVVAEVRERMYEKQKSAATTKGLPNMKTSEILGMSALVIYDFKQGRAAHYDFKWENVLSFGVLSGIRLQYVHCRLTSLLKNGTVEMANECDPSALTEPEVIRLVIDIARFEEAVHFAAIRLDPAVLTNYLFQLTASINSAFNRLSVKNADPHLAKQRLCLFNRSRLVIAEGLRLLGLPALEQM